MKYGVEKNLKIIYTYYLRIGLMEVYKWKL